MQTTIRAVRTPVFQKLDAAYETGRYNVFVLEGGSRSSKTYSIIQFWIKWAFENQGLLRRVVIGRKKATWVTGTVLHDFLNVIKELGLYDKRLHNKSTGAGLIRLFDTEFWFMGLDDDQRIHGMETDGFWINEGVEAGYDDWAQLMQRCKGFCIVDYNPSYEEHWIYDRLCKRAKTCYMHSTMLDNPMIPQAAKEQILSYEPTDQNIAEGTADRAKWSIYGLGKRASVEGVVYENWRTVKQIPTGITPIRRYGLDFGYTNDVTAIVDMHWSRGTKDLWVDEVCYKTHMLNTDIGKTLKEAGLQTVKGYADNEPKSIEEIYRMGCNIHPAQKPAGSILQGIDILKRYRINITERSLNGIKELRNYTWKQDKNGLYVNEPIDNYNHFLDAARYVAFMELGERSPGAKSIARVLSGTGR